jgi:hypothetical protein
MKTMFSAKRCHWTAMISIFLVGGALVMLTVGCEDGMVSDVACHVNISSTAGESVTTPGEGYFGIACWKSSTWWRLQILATDLLRGITVPP